MKIYLVKTPNTGIIMGAFTKEEDANNYAEYKNTEYNLENLFWVYPITVHKSLSEVLTIH